MSVLIKGMEMPKYCYTCPAYDYIHSTCCVLHTEVKDLDDKRYKDCPLVEVPTPHGRLIDADYLKERLVTLQNKEIQEEKHARILSRKGKEQDKGTDPQNIQ